MWKKDSASPSIPPDDSATLGERRALVSAAMDWSRESREAWLAPIVKPAGGRPCGKQRGGRTTR